MEEEGGILLQTLTGDRDFVNSHDGTFLSLYDSADQILSEEESASKRQSRENHRRAALLVKEGKDNEKFDSLPSRKTAIIAYRILHNPLYYWFALIMGCVLLLLAAFEQPSTFTQSHDIAREAKHLVVELFLLSFFTIDLIIRFVWLGPKLFLKSRATFVCIILIVMYLEVFVIFISNNRHVRITRALRPFILLDTYLMFGSRRVIRQIFLCLKYIIDVMLVLFFLVAVFALVGYFLFTNINPTYFGTLTESIVSMIITLTTANHPDVFMESYYKSSVSPIFFMVYMFVTFYYFNNVLLAVVFAKFKSAEKKKYKKLFLHKREALHLAFALLKDENDHIVFLDFFHFMKKYSPRAAPYEVICLFKVLQSSGGVDGCLTWDEFSNFYEYENMKWELTNKTGVAVTWYERIEGFPMKPKMILYYIHFAVNHWVFDIIVTAIVLANLIYLLVFITVHEKTCRDSYGQDQFCAARLGIAGSFIFNIIYIIEIHLRLFLDGPIKYFRKWSNWVDYILIVGSFICLCVEVALINHANTHGITGIDSLRYVAMVRPLKLLRLLRLKKNYFFLIRILMVLARRMTSVFFLLMIVFYSFSIIGMEAFTGEENRVKPGCCVNASFGVGTYYSNDGSIPDNPNLYWLNNFDTLGRSYVTLYEEMVVNNWFIQMEGFVSTTSQAARLYFILFWMITTLVVNIAIVYIVDAFESGILALKASGKEEDSSLAELKKVIRIVLTNTDMRQLVNVIKLTFDKSKRYSINSWIRKHSDIPARTIAIYKGEFRGKRMMNNDDLRVIIYESEIEEWKKEYDEKRASSITLDTSQPQDNSLLTLDKKFTFRDTCKKILGYIGRNLKRLFFYIFS